ncbi:MAG: DUF2163 domain-containing protein [Porphyrobacter sp.]|nr:DUF2163 domain-containing protein [Porphyrobacter sp.]
MSRVFFQRELEGVATFWRIRRTDGVAIGLTSHDRDLWFDGMRHLGSPGMVPSAIRRTADFSADSAEVQGALTHDSIDAADLAAGRFDGARVEIGLVDWETLESAILYRGTIGGVAEEAGGYQAELESIKAKLEADPVPRTSPTCRAQFCGPGCTLNPVRFTHEAVLAEVDDQRDAVRFTGVATAEKFVDGTLRWIDGEAAGRSVEVVDADGEWLLLEQAAGIAAGTRAVLREGCDHTLATCRDRFGNAVNFRGEPFLPGNDMLARYPQSQ